MDDQIQISRYRVTNKLTQGRHENIGSRKRWSFYVRLLAFLWQPDNQMECSEHSATLTPTRCIIASKAQSTDADPSFYNVPLGSKHGIFIVVYRK